jgi:dienelactone hydrolase
MISLRRYIFMVVGLIFLVIVGFIAYIVILKFTSIGLIKKEKPVLVTANGYPMKYYISLPKEWTPQRKWTILVNIEPNGAYYEGAIEYARNRKNLPFIVITPLVLTNQGSVRRSSEYPSSVWDEVNLIGAAAFDQEGLSTIIKNVQEAYNGQDKFFITGWSAGGHLTWLMIFNHPEQLAAAALAAGNFSGRGIAINTVSNSPERVDLAIQEFLGDRDKIYSSLQSQWEVAVELAHKNGYKNLSQVIVKDANHNRFSKQVLAYFNSILSKQK